MKLNIERWIFFLLTLLFALPGSVMGKEQIFIMGAGPQLVNFINSKSGKYAIGFGVKSNFTDQQIVTIPGFVDGVNLGLVFDRKNEEHPLIKDVKEYAESDAWHHAVKGHGYFLPE